PLAAGQPLDGSAQLLAALAGQRELVGAGIVAGQRVRLRRRFRGAGAGRRRSDAVTSDLAARVAPERADGVVHRAADAVAGEGREARATPGVVAPGGLDEANHAVAFEVLELDVPLELAPDPPGDRGHEVDVLVYQVVAPHVGAAHSKPRTRAGLGQVSDIRT